MITAADADASPEICAGRRAFLSPDEVVNGVEADQSHDDQIDRHDEAQQPRHEQPPAADRPKNMGGSGRVIERKLIATVRRESAVVAAAMATVPENSYIFPALKRSRH